MPAPSPLLAFLNLRLADMPTALPAALAASVMLGLATPFLYRYPLDALPALSLCALTVVIAWRHFRPHWWPRLWRPSQPCIQQALSKGLYPYQTTPHPISVTLTLPPLSISPERWGFYAFDAHAHTPEMAAAARNARWSHHTAHLHPADLFADRYRMGEVHSITLALPHATAHERLARHRAAQDR